MKYIQLKVSMEPWNDDVKEVLVAELSESGYEGFYEDDKILQAYIPESLFNQAVLEEIISAEFYSSIAIGFEKESLPDKNWNEEWEKDYPPVIIDDICVIKTEFHKVDPAEYNIIIEPKMSFGTGHHETTRLMIRHMWQNNFEGKTVLDMGCGTGVLGIFALMRGAGSVLAVDIDEWACINSEENFRRNVKTDNYEILKADAKGLPSKKFNIILANINRNILLEDMKTYVDHIGEGGNIIVSGILESDREMIVETAQENGLSFVSELYENKWISINFMK